LLTVLGFGFFVAAMMLMPKVSTSGGFWGVYRPASLGAGGAID
jgi:hypothetical protein